MLSSFKKSSFPITQINLQFTHSTKNWETQQPYLIYRNRHREADKLGRKEKCSKQKNRTKLQKKNPKK